LWIGNIDTLTTTESMVKSEFIKFGLIENVKILPEKQCAFVNYYELNSALEAKRVMSGQLFRGRQLRINFGKTEVLNVFGSEEIVAGMN
jgi:protein JSN1